MPTGIKGPSVGVDLRGSLIYTEEHEKPVRLPGIDLAGMNHRNHHNYDHFGGSIEEQTFEPAKGSKPMQLVSAAQY